MGTQVIIHVREGGRDDVILEHPETLTDRETEIWVHGIQHGIVQAYAVLGHEARICEVIEDPFR